MAIRHYDGSLSHVGRVLADRERNGYDDSDFYAIVFDEDGCGFSDVTYASTRFGGGGSCAIDATPAVRALYDVYVRHGRAQLAAEDDQYRCTQPQPGDVRKGARVQMIKSGRFQDKRAGKDVEYAAGEEAVVTWVGSYGAFYRNGYNRPGRGNTRVGVRFDDGRMAFVTLAKVRLAEEPRAAAAFLAG